MHGYKWIIMYAAILIGRHVLKELRSTRKSGIYRLGCSLHNLYPGSPIHFKRWNRDVTFFFSVFWHKHVDQLGDARLTEFFEFQLITRCKRERRKFMYLVSSVGMLRAISTSGAPSNYAIFSTASRQKCIGADAWLRSNERRYVFISHTRISVREPNFENYVARVAAS